MGDKWRSLNVLGKINMNTPKPLAFYDPSVVKDGEAFFKKWIASRTSLMGINPHPRISIRTEKKGMIKSPHLPNITLDEFKNRLPELLRGSYDIIVCEGIDPADCLFKGNLVHTQQERWILEYKEGPGTVRSLESGMVPINIQWTGNIPPIPEELKPIFAEYKRHYNLLDRSILEWSIYNKPLGLYMRPEIFWEYRPWC